MPRMSNVARVLERAGHNADTLTDLSLSSLNADAERNFCLERCTHAECKGECLEFRPFLKELTKIRKKQKMARKWV